MKKPAIHVTIDKLSLPASYPGGREALQAAVAREVRMRLENPSADPGEPRTVEARIAREILRHSRSDNSPLSES